MRADSWERYGISAQGPVAGKAMTASCEDQRVCPVEAGRPIQATRLGMVDGVQVVVEIDAEADLARTASMIAVR